MKASVRACVVTAMLSVAAISTQGCAYDPYTGTYVAYAAPAYGYYPYPYSGYYYPPPVYGSVVIGSGWGWGGDYGGWYGGRYRGWHR